MAIVNYSILQLLYSCKGKENVCPVCITIFQLLHQGLNSLALKQIYRVKNLSLSLLFSEHGQKLGTSIAIYPKQWKFVARGPRRAGYLHKRCVCCSKGWKEMRCVGTLQCCCCGCVEKYHFQSKPGSLRYNKHEGFSCS